ncbi:MAG: hypothetical protein AB1782_11765 [Cyanobacteriota bacterium]
MQKAISSRHRSNLETYKAFHNSNVKICYKSKYKTSRLNQYENDLITPDLLERLIAFSCYYTFGLTGILSIFLNIISNRKSSRFVILNIYQSALLLIVSSLLILSLKFIIFAGSLILANLECYVMLGPILFPYITLSIFIILSIFALFSLSGKLLLFNGAFNAVSDSIKYDQ